MTATRGSGLTITTWFCPTHAYRSQRRTPVTFVTPRATTSSHRCSKGSVHRKRKTSS
jgi:hypothetical protein